MVWEKTYRKLSRKFKRKWKNYLIQSSFATFTIFIALMLPSIEKRAIIVASIGATAFIVFTMPRNITAKPKNVIGGYLVGIICGSLSALIPHQGHSTAMFIYSLAVGLSIFVMVLIDAEHPPAAGSALSFAVTGFSFNAAIFVIFGAIILSVVRHFMKPYLKTLT